MSNIGSLIGLVAAWLVLFLRVSGGAPAEELIQNYDVFSPDMRSTRWEEFCRMLQHDRFV